MSSYRSRFRGSYAQNTSAIFNYEKLPQVKSAKNASSKTFSLPWKNRYFENYHFCMSWSTGWRKIIDTDRILHFESKQTVSYTFFYIGALLNRVSTHFSIPDFKKDDEWRMFNVCCWTTCMPPFWYENMRSKIPYITQGSEEWWEDEMTVKIIHSHIITINYTNYILIWHKGGWPTNRTWHYVGI